ncbi:hypothetical protein LXL04_024475 [Taraxacum kok-saghyz]
MMFVKDMSGSHPMYKKAFVYFSSPIPKEFITELKADTSVLPRIGALREMKLEYFPVENQRWDVDLNKCACESLNLNQPEIEVRNESAKDFLQWEKLTGKVLGSIPTYLLSLFRAPCSVIDALEKYRKRFLWGGAANKNAISWVSWKVVLDAKERGGLRIGSLKSLNVAFIVKWLWRMNWESMALWRRDLDLDCDQQQGGAFWSTTTYAKCAMRIERIVIICLSGARSLWRLSLGF